MWWILWHSTFLCLKFWFWSWFSINCMLVPHFLSLNIIYLLVSLYFEIYLIFSSFLLFIQIPDHLQLLIEINWSQILICFLIINFITILNLLYIVFVIVSYTCCYRFLDNQVINILVKSLHIENSMIICECIFKIPSSVF